MFHKRWFWIGLTLVSVTSALFSYHFFDRAFPIVSLDLRMDRTTALASAREWEQRFHLGPAGYRQAVSFGVDGPVQNFVELEAGGKPAFAAMIKGGLYSPYTWRVRHFKEGETREVLWTFTPEGNLYGFDLKLPEKEKGAALTPEAAQAIAENAARQDWKIDLGKYQLAEKSQEIRPGKRVDHTFVYERPDVRIGQGRYRLRLVVGGDRLSELTHFIKVPEAFSRRYEEMRSANSAISMASGIGMVVLYLMGGCGVGLFFLLRQHRVIWQTPLLWAGVIGLLLMLAGFNEWPLLWMDYDTALSTGSFALKQVLSTLAGSLGMGFLMMISFTAAESLSRKAFPGQWQFWRLWSAPAAASRPVLGRTLGGYLLLPVFLAYVIAFYFVASRWLNWWTPSDILVDPNILGTYCPWLSSIALSAQAGFWEESLFRAVPLACAALLGNRFGRRSWWIVGAMVVQTLVFGAGHAGYANQPSYARLVELVVPSLGFGSLYLVFGLLPSIILHYSFDVLMMSLPLFVSAAPGIWVDRTLVVLLLLVPGWVVLGARWRKKQWVEAPASLKNEAWTPVIPAAELPPPEPLKAAQGMRPFLLWGVPLAGVAGLVLWLGLAEFQMDSPAVQTGRTEAIHAAQKVLETRNISLSAQWKRSARLDASPGEEDRFLFQTANQETYHRLMGTYLDPPLWSVRFARFEGDVAERAEEYLVWIDGQGRLFRFLHQLPEGRPGKSLSEDEARVLAGEGLQKIFHLEAAHLKEISAVPSKLKDRTDWTFTFADSARTPLPQGEARLSLKVSGDQLTDASRFIFVPEEWTRQERDHRTLPGIVENGAMAMVGLLILGGSLLAIVLWSRKKFSLPTFLFAGAFFCVLAITNLLNRIPLLVSFFSTAQPFLLQFYIAVGASLVGLGVVAVCLSLMAGLVGKWKPANSPLSLARIWVGGISVGLLWNGLLTASHRLSPPRMPTWGDYSALNQYFPVWGKIGGLLWKFGMELLVALFLFTLVDWATAGWRKNKYLGSLILLGFGFTLSGLGSVESLASWAAVGLFLGLFLVALYHYLFRFELSTVIIAIFTSLLLGMMRQGLQQPYPAAVAHSLLTAVLLSLAAWFWWRQFRKTPRDGEGVKFEECSLANHEAESPER